MREIKYQAWVETFAGGRMFDVESIWILGGKAERIHTIDKFKFKNDEEPIHLRQFTDLQDKNGTDIYEGDICNFTIGQEAVCLGSRYKIIWIRSAWGFEPLFPELVHTDDREPKAFYVDPFEGDDWSTKYFEIVGNIYENPELLND